MEEEEAGGEGGGELRRPRARHIKKRALKNKAFAVSFDEKDLRDFVTGFHKRKKKRRKEGQQQLVEAQRRKRIQERKKRKLEKELVYGGALPDSSAGPDEVLDDSEQDEQSEPVPSVSGMTTYDSGDVKVTVTTSEISRDEETPSQRPQAVGSIEGNLKKLRNVHVSKRQPFKKIAKSSKPRKKPHNKRVEKKGKKKGKH
ncbi:uncharacterized protein LOC127807856 [Diospyros lotus]|uniref:uncharacterized protein LOC127807856 n=1 Tax=Diospyros lotus TaxID=55363 RepID=UPI00225BEF8B|nr:uncharacterized protein LOC127807856 [Diospyros lotus]